MQDRLSWRKPLDRAMQADLQAPKDSQGDHWGVEFTSCGFQEVSLTHRPSKQTRFDPQFVPNRIVALEF